MLRSIAALCLCACTLASAQSKGTPDAATQRWWAHTQVLASDKMEGRDTGSPGYDRAAAYVVEQFKKAGLKPAGTDGFYQSFKLNSVELVKDKSSVEVIGKDGTTTALRLLQEVNVPARADLAPTLEAPLVFVGYGLPSRAGTATEMKGKIAVYFNGFPAAYTHEQRLHATAERAHYLASMGVAAIVAIDNPMDIEPTHWPMAYSRSVTIVDATPPKQAAAAPLYIRISAEAAGKLFINADHAYREILNAGQQGLPLAPVEMTGKLRIKTTLASKDITSFNLIAILPGSDADLSKEYVAVSAHLDGYGYGEPVNGDNIYNGALDDAAYVSTLIELANTIHASGKPLKRSLLICVFTGEEKGLLGSVYFTQHPTVNKTSIVADLNLDQLRPLFPLKALTMEGLDDSSLGATARAVASTFHIQIRPDLEPERNLVHRADNASFARIGVPSCGFVFAYDPGTPEEVIYKDWYRRRYHQPDDDLNTPMDWEAAGKFNRFYDALVAAIANADSRPTWNTQLAAGTATLKSAQK